MEGQPYKPRRPLLGIRDAIKRRTAVKAGSWKFGEVFFRTIVASAPFTRYRPLDAIIKRVALMGGSHHTAGFSVPLNVDLADGVAPVTLPIELMRQTVRDASYRAIMSQCLCRRTFDCHDYPHDVGCLFLGDAARACVANGVAREAGIEECFAHIDKAASLGLAGHAFWVEVEEFVWGFQDQRMQQFLEICFCCPCCCAAFRYEEQAWGETRHILHKSIGWTCIVGEDCKACGDCVKTCPRHLITVGPDRAVVDSDCSGCGLCIDICATGALHLEQQATTKPRLVDYFDGLDLRI